MTRITAGLNEFNVFDSGAGPVLLLVHGFPLDHTMWQNQLAHFAPAYRVLAPDLRGFGGSTLARSPGDSQPPATSMQSHADDLALLLDALNVRQPITLCGLSMGGYIALRFVERHPQRLARLVLCDTRAAADTPQAAEGRRKTAAQVVADGSQVVADSMIPKLFSQHTVDRRPDLVDQVRQVMRHADPQAVASALLAMAQRPDSTPLLPRIGVPTLLVVGEQDAITPPDEMRKMAGSIPAAQFAQIKDAGHLAPLENPSTFNDVLTRFLA